MISAQPTPFQPTVRFACSDCGTLIQVPTTMCNHRGRCPGCMSALVVPPLEEPEPEEPAVSQLVITKKTGLAVAGCGFAFLGLFALVAQGLRNEPAPASYPVAIAPPPVVSGQEFAETALRDATAEIEQLRRVANGFLRASNPADRATFVASGTDLTDASGWEGLSEVGGSVPYSAVRYVGEMGSFGGIELVQLACIPKGGEEVMPIFIEGNASTGYGINFPAYYEYRTERLATWLSVGGTAEDQTFLVRLSPSSSKEASAKAAPGWQGYRIDLPGTLVASDVFVDPQNTTLKGSSLSKMPKGKSQLCAVTLRRAERDGKTFHELVDLPMAAWLSSETSYQAWRLWN